MNTPFPRPRATNSDDVALKGVYLITPDDVVTARLLARVAPLLDEGVALLQYRNKLADATLKREQATALQALCHGMGVPLIVNDDVRLAREIGAAGVHLGEDDGDLRAAREQLGEAAILGASCYDDLGLARRAIDAGASYIAFGAFFPTSTKNTTHRADLTLLRAAAQFGVPRCCIGGITAQNARPLVEAGAEMIAVIGGVFNAADPVAALRECKAAFNTPARP